MLRKRKEASHCGWGSQGCDGAMLSENALKQQRSFVVNLQRDPTCLATDAPGKRKCIFVGESRLTRKRHHVMDGDHGFVMGQCRERKLSRSKELHQRSLDGALPVSQTTYLATESYSGGEDFLHDPVVILSKTLGIEESHLEFPASFCVPSFGQRVVADDTSRFRRRLASF